MRILVIADTPASDLARPWSDWGHEVRVVAARRPPASIRAVFGLVTRGLKAGRPDLVVVVPGAWPAALAARLLAAFRRRPLVLVAGADWSSRIGAAAVIVPTMADKTALMERGVDGGRIAVVDKGAHAGEALQILEIAAAGWGGRIGEECGDAAETEGRGR